MSAEKTMYEMRQYLYSKQLHDLLDQGITPKNAVNMLDSKFDKDMNLSKSELSEQVSKSEKSISEQNAIRIQSYQCGALPLCYISILSFLSDF